MKLKGITFFTHVLITFLILGYYSAFGQLNKYVTNMTPEQNFYTIQYNMTKYLDSLQKVTDSAVFYSGDSEYNRFKIFESIWEPRVSPHGEFSRYYDAVADYYENREDDYSHYLVTPWHELGPKTLQTSGSKGIGPVEFVTFYDNGTDDSTFIMLTGSTVGGLFYSTDAANTWQSTGTDAWPQSGCGWAEFHPNDYKTWYASSSGNFGSTESLWIGPTGGVFRTKDEGQTWEQIGDENDFDGDYTIIFKILLNRYHPSVLFTATENGLYRTTNCNEPQEESIIWNKVLDGQVYDLEMKPGCDSIFYASMYDDSLARWQIMVSENNGNPGSWDTIVAQPNMLHNDNKDKEHLTIEVSKAQPDYLYCVSRDTLHRVHYINLATDNSWTDVGSHTIGFGDGHGFGVKQTNNGEAIYASRYTGVIKHDLSIDTSFSTDIVHVDVEDIVCHPYHDGEVWQCTHGGVEKSTDGGENMFARYNGLGVAQVEGFANAYTGAKYVFAGLYHDGVQLTIDEYKSNWMTDWKWCVYGDGMKPLINNIDPNFMWGPVQKGLWYYSEDAMQTRTKITEWDDTYFLTTGILNKVNPDIFYFNKYSNAQDEDVNRLCMDSSLNNGQISNFKDYLPPLDRTQVIGLYTPYNKGDYLIANVINVDTATNTNSSFTRHHLFRTINANEADTLQVAWQELSIPTNKRWIADVEYDTDNPDIIYLAYAGSWLSPQNDSMIFRIDYSDPQFPVYEKITKNLPFTTISNHCLAVDTSGKGSIYLGTGYGVFYTDNELMQHQGDEWQLMGTGLPHVSISGLELNYPSNTLRVATFGRGIWEMPLPCPTSDSAITITNDTAWNGLMYIESNIVIETGATLTINYPGELQFPEGAKLIVKPGARLVLDSCLLTWKCYKHWRGIEVWGNDTLSQTTANQGKIEIKNGSIISNAEVAVRMGKTTEASPEGGSTPPEDRKGGGIIIAENSTFENNNIGVLFEPYAYHNTSRFLQCTFDRNLPVSEEETFYHTKLYNIKHVRFAGCDFLNNSGTLHDGYGIWSSNSTFYVDRFCTALYGDDCTNWDAGNFTNLLYGVYSIASTPVPFTDVRNTHFNLNETGIYLGGITLARVTENHFSVGNSSTTSVGLYLDECTDYWIEGNECSPQVFHSGTCIGIVVNESGPEPNLIYRNTFDYLDYSILAQGVNRDSRTGEGLVCKCNTFSNAGYDIAVTDADQGETTEFGIAQYQGSPATQPDAPAGNLFSWTGPVGSYSDINNLGLQFTYYYHDNQPQYLHLEPKYYDTLKVNAEANQNALWNSSSCPSFIDTTGGGGSTEEEIRDLLAESQQLSDSLSGLIQALEDAGDTEALEWTVDMSMPEQSWEVYMQLMNTAPYISETVMGAAIENEVVLPDAMIRDVMVASPEAAKSDALLQQLDERTYPLPAYMLAQILQGRSLVSVYGDLLARLSYHNNRKALASKVLRHLYISDTASTSATDSLIALLQRNTHMQPQVQLAFYYLQLKDSVAAVNTLNAISDNYVMDEQQLQEYALLTGYMNQLTAMKGSLPDSTQVAWLMNATVSGQGRASTWARNLLLGLGLIDYTEPIVLPQTTKSTPLYIYRNPGVQAKAANLLEVYPNPASDHIIVKWMLDSKPTALRLKVISIDGKLLYETPLSGSMGQKVISTNNLLQGIYLVSIHDGNKTIGSVKVSVN